MFTHILTKKNLKQLILFVGVVGMLLLAMQYVPHALAQGADPNDKMGWLGDRNPNDNFRSSARDIVNYFLYFLGFLATCVIIYGGVQYVTAAGAQDKIDGAKKTITYAVIGIIVILLSFAIVNTVLSSGQPNAEPAAN